MVAVAGWQWDRWKEEVKAVSLVQKWTVEGVQFFFSFLVILKHAIEWLYKQVSKLPMVAILAAFLFQLSAVNWRLAVGSG
jgi:hypothetical protein